MPNKRTDSKKLSKGTKPGVQKATPRLSKRVNTERKLILNEEGAVDHNDIPKKKLTGFTALKVRSTRTISMLNTPFAFTKAKASKTNSKKILKSRKPNTNQKKRKNNFISLSPPPTKKFSVDSSGTIQDILEELDLF